MVANNQRGRHQGEQLVPVLHHGEMPCGTSALCQKRTLCSAANCTYSTTSSAVI